MEIAAKYAPQQIEKKWYDYWVEHGFFHSVLRIQLFKP
jgi:valyl-tRNA synthetase